MSFCRVFWDNNIFYVDNLDKTATATIKRNSVLSTETNYPVLLVLDSTVGAGDIFTQLDADYKKLYVKNDTVNLDVLVEYWNETDNQAKVWVIVDSLPVAGLDLTLAYDNTASDNADISMLEDTIGTYGYGPDVMVLAMATTATSETVLLPLINNSYIINWGDGSTETVATDYPSHTYTNIGTYNVSVESSSSRLYGYGLSVTNRAKWKGIKQWGTSKFTSMYGAFRECIGQDVTALDTPDLTLCTSFQEFMRESSNVIIDEINNWDTSNVTNMQSAFNESDFNKDISDWGVSEVTNMSYMFNKSKAFNQDISDWNVSKVTTMYYMFYRDEAFNTSINGWDLDVCSTFYGMFRGAKVFNADLNNWTLSTTVGINVNYMFSSNGLINTPVFTDSNDSLNTWTNTISIDTMKHMFSGQKTSWGRIKFNGQLDNWDTSNVTDMSYMFSVSEFNQDISGWDVGNVTDMSSMFLTGLLSQTNYDLLLLGWSAQTVQQNVPFHAGTTKYSATSQDERDTLTVDNGWTITDGGSA